MQANVILRHWLPASVAGQVRHFASQATAEQHADCHNRHACSTQSLAVSVEPHVLTPERG